MKKITLEEVDQFKYLGSTPAKYGTSIKEVKIRQAQTHSAMTRLAIRPTVEKQHNQISYKDTCLVNTVLWM